VIPPIAPGGPDRPPVVLKYGMPFGPVHPPVPQPPILPKYGIRTPTAQRVYLTPQQRQQIQSATGCAPCDYFEIQPGMRMLYGVPLVHE